MKLASQFFFDRDYLFQASSRYLFQFWDIILKKSVFGSQLQTLSDLGSTSQAYNPVCRVGSASLEILKFKVCNFSYEFALF